MYRLYATLFTAGILSTSLHIDAKEGLLLEHSYHLNLEQAAAATKWARNHLPQTGVLKEGRDGFVYLKVDDNYINELYPRLRMHGYSKPPYFRRSDSPGAHISVFYKGESQRIGKITEIGQTFQFQIMRLALVPPKTRKYLVLQVESPELEKLRSKYGLSPKLQDHDFHITIETKKPHSHRSFSAD